MLITAHFLNETKSHRDFCNEVRYKILAECICGTPTAGVTMLRVTRNPIVLLSTVRRSGSQMSLKIGVLNNFAKFHRNTPAFVSLFNNVSGLQA